MTGKNNTRHMTIFFCYETEKILFCFLTQNPLSENWSKRVIGDLMGCDDRAVVLVACEFQSSPKFWLVTDMSTVRMVMSLHPQ